MNTEKIDIENLDILHLLDFYNIEYKRDFTNTYKCNCVLHSENTPSMVLYVKTNTFFCFGCRAGGNVASFIMQYENIGFIQSLDRIRHVYNINENNYNQIKKTVTKPLEVKKDEKKPITDKYHDIYFDVLEYCKNIPNKDALNYLASRCLTVESIEKSNIQTFDYSLLSKFLRYKYSTDELNQSGLLINLANYQIVIPYYLNGKICNLQFRSIDLNHTPKYKFLKDITRLNYNLDTIQKNKNKRIGVCEGVFDAISLKQMNSEFDIKEKYLKCSGVVSLHSATVNDLELFELLSLIKNNDCKVTFFIDNDKSQTGLKLKDRIDNVSKNVGIKVKYFMHSHFKDVNEFYITLKNDTNI